MKQATMQHATKSKPFAAKMGAAIDNLFHFASTPLARRLVLGLFVLQAVVLVFAVRIGTPPDETNHVQFIEYYAQHSLSPVFTGQKPTLNLGDKTREVDYIYHYTASLVYRVLPLSAQDKYTTIRLFTVALSLICLLVLANVFRRLGVSPGAITVGLLIVTNLPMVLMMSAAINNDVLVWLGTVLGVLLLLRLWKQPSATDLLWLAVLCVAGGLVKRNLLVLGMIFAVLGFVVFIRNARAILSELKRFNWHICAAAIVLLLGLALFTERVGGNLVHYGAVAPTCEQVQGEAACYNFWASARARSLAKTPAQKTIPPAAFVARWFKDSTYNIVDIQTQFWRHDVQPFILLTPLLAGLLVIGLVYGVFYERARFAAEQVARHRMYVLLIASVYIAMQLAVNYSTYMHYKVYGVALNGRYIIPSMLLLSGLACFYWTKMLARHPRWLTVLAVCVALATILGSGLIMMLRNHQLYPS